MIVHVIWKSKKRRENWYEATFASVYDERPVGAPADPPSKAGDRVTIVADVDGDERTIYLCDVKSVGIFDGGKEIRHLHPPQETKA